MLESAQQSRSGEVMQRPKCGAGARRAPLAVAVVLALCAAQAGAGEQTQTAMRPGAVALREQLRSLAPVVAKGATHAAVTLPVTSCADDDGVATLRAAVAAAGEGDTVDLSQLHCSAISLSQGAIPVLLDDLTVVGPGAGVLAIDGAGAGRVFVHPGAGALVLQGLTVRNGTARVSGLHVTGGGCIASAGHVVLDHTVVTDCNATAEGVYGGGVFAYGLSMYTSTLSRCTGFGDVPDTGTATFGGGAYANTLTLVDSTLSGNRAAHAAGRSGYDIGGGAFSNLGGSISGSTVEGNYATGIGGGIASFGGAIGIVDSTISGNVAATGSGGGLDLRLSSSGSAIASSTIAGNSAASGGGVYLRGTPRSFTLQSSLLAGNSASAGGADFGSIAAVGIDGANNLVVAAGAAVVLPGDTLHTDPLLQPLADNGGPTRTRALSAGSPALDAGNNVAGLAYDQRGSGFPRVVGATADIGAFEGYRIPLGKVPAASATNLLLLGALLTIGAFVALRRRKTPGFSIFTPLSPRSEHSSHT
jgi:hypothetical protein